MKRKVPVVIKSLGKRSGNVSARTLERVVREARGRVKLPKDRPLRIEDTASGAGHIRFQTETPTTGKRHKAA